METITFGVPTGNVRIAVVAIVVPAEPPSDIMPFIFFSFQSCVTICAAPFAMIATLFPRSAS